MAKVQRSRAATLLRAWLARHKTSQAAFAAKVGVAQTAVSAWLDGSEPRATRAVQIQRLTRIPVSAWGEFDDAA